MAEDILFKIETDGSGTERTIGELRQEFKDLQKAIGQTKEGTDEYRKSIIRLGEVKGQLKDVKEQMIALDPEKRFAAFAQIGASVASGFAAAQGAMALFGTENEDLTRVLVKVQAATALASGLQGLVGMQKALTTAGLAMRAFALSNPFTAIAAAVVALVGVIWGLVEAFDETQEKIDALTDSNNLLADSFKRIGDESELAVRKLKAQGADEQTIFEAQQKRRTDEIENMRQRILNLQEISRSEVGLTDEQFKELTTLEDAFILAKKEKEIAKLEFHKEMSEKGLKITQDALDKEEAAQDKADAKAKKAAKEKADATKKEWDEHIRLVIEGMDAKNAAEILDFEDKKKRKQNEADEMAAMDLANAELTKKVLNEDAETEKKRIQKEIDDAKKIKEAKIQISADGFRAIGALALAFAGQGERAQRRAFEINKKAQIAATIIETISSASKAFNSLAAIPIVGTILGAAAAVVVAAAGLARVKAIQKTEFASTSVSAADVGTGGGGGGGNVTAPTIEPPQNQQQQVSSTQTQTNQQGDFTGFNQPIRAYVLETEISNSQKTISGIESRAEF